MHRRKDRRGGRDVALEHVGGVEGCRCSHKSCDPRGVYCGLGVTDSVGKGAHLDEGDTPDGLHVAVPQLGGVQPELRQTRI